MGLVEFCLGWLADGQAVFGDGFGDWLAGWWVGFEVSWRDLLRLILLSLGLTIAAATLFARNAPGRRAFVALAAVALLLTPAIAGWVNPIIPVGMHNPLALGLEHAIPGWLLIIIGAISLVGLVRAARTLWQTQQALARLPALSDSRLDSEAALLVDRLSLGRLPKFCLAETSDTAAAHHLPTAPFVSSFGRGTVVLPADYTSYDKPTLRAVIAHELVHMARRDDYWCVLLRLVVSVYWFLPWLRSLERRYWLAMEHSCDDRAADFFGRRRHYMEGVVGALRTPVAAATQCPGELSHRTMAAAPVTVQTTHPLLQRVMRFGQRREFDTDAALVTGYLGLTLAISLVIGSLLPIAKPSELAPGAPMGVAAAGFHLPLTADSSLANQAAQAALQSVPSVAASRPYLVNPQAAGQRLLPMDQPLPIYPGAALRGAVEGDVWVEYQVADDGSVMAAQIIRSQPQAVFDKATLRSLRYLQYPSVAHRAEELPQFHRDVSAARQLRVRQRFRYQLHSAR